MSNKVEEDFLEVDQPIPGQNFCCMSFISPENIIKQKDVFFLKHFLLDLLNDEKKREYLLGLDKERVTYQKVSDMFEDFLLAKEKQVNDEFDEVVDFKTSVRGVKIRGVYDTRREAEVRAKVLQRRDPKFNVFVGQVGYWLPWDPSNLDNVDQEYTETQLNELMKNYRENIEKRDMFYEEEKRERIEKAREETKQKKMEKVKAGELKTQEVPTNDATDEKLKEMKSILDQKDAKFNAFMKQKKDAKSATLDTTDEKKVVPLVTIETDKKEVSTGEAKLDENKNIVNEKEDDPLGSKSGYSDPWMKRKMEGEEKLEVAKEPTESMTHSADDVVGQKQDNNLKDAVKSIF